MGCFCCEKEKIILGWEYLKNIVLESDLINLEEDSKLYLINTESIPNYMTIINQNALLVNNSKRNEESLKNLFEKYSLEESIKIIDDFNICKDMAQKNDVKQNKFLIVNEYFFNIKDKPENEKEKYVNIRVDENNKKNEIYFPNSNETLEIKYKENGIFNFIININESNDIPFSNTQNRNKNQIENNSHKNIPTEVNSLNSNKNAKMDQKNEKNDTVVYKRKTDNDSNNYIKNKNMKDNLETNGNNNINNSISNNMNNQNNNMKNQLNNNMNNLNNNQININNNNAYLNNNVMNNNQNIQNNQQKAMTLNIKNNNQNQLSEFKMTNSGQNPNQINTMNQLNSSNNPMNNLGINKFNCNDNQQNINNMQINPNINNNLEINNNNNNNLLDEIKGDKEKEKNNYLTRIKVITKPPLIGLENTESTSYMNAVLQCLSNIYILSGYFLSNKALFTNNPFHFKEKQISKYFSQIIYYLWNQNESDINSIYIFNQIINSRNIKDAKNLLIFLYESFHEELNSIKNNQIINNEITDKKNAEYELNKFLNNYCKCNRSIISDFFHFIQANITTCINCNTALYNFQVNNILIFSIEKMPLFKNQKGEDLSNISLKDFFNYYISPEQSEKNQYCDNCNTESAHMIQKKFGTFPEVLTIILDRNQQSKYDYNFRIDDKLTDLDDYLIKLNCNREYSGIKYELIGIIFSNCDSGINEQYFTYCKSPVNTRWYLYNNSNIQNIKDPIKENKGIPYIFFYQKI